MTKKVRRVNPSAPRAIAPHGGHGLPSLLKKRKRTKATPQQAAYRQRR